MVATVVDIKARKQYAEQHLNKFYRVYREHMSTIP